jgi:predicted secreted hydrolase
MGLMRRQFLMGSGLCAFGGLGGLAPIAARAQGRELEFPRDHGSHPDFRTEWWYITGQAFKSRNDGASASVDTGNAQALVQGEPDFGFQITFFRKRVDVTQGMQSRFAAKQLIVAHAAVTDVLGKKLWHDQRIARSADSPQTDLASASKRNTELTLRDWSLKRTAVANSFDPDAAPGSLYQAKVAGRDFGLDLKLRSVQPVLLQGEAGWSRKGPEDKQASQYYSQPQLRTDGVITLGGKAFDIKGRAWLDHEWSEELLHRDAVGWDWVGMNLDDGSALTAFRVRDTNGRTLWDGGSFRSSVQAQAQAQVQGQGQPNESVAAERTSFRRGEVVFRPIRNWKSPLSGASYPVEWIVRTPVDFYTVRALVDNQELDSRQSTGAVYWEGLCELLNSAGQRVGRGYLEMTGYAKPLRM